MKALALCHVGKFEIREVPSADPGPRDVTLRISTVGICGTDFQIFEGKANYHIDVTGRLVPLSESPQILGHEMCGIVERVGREVPGLRLGTRVIIDQGLNCSSRNRPLCEYCATGNTHQCESFGEHGITGLQGGMAERLTLPAVNVIPIADGVPTRAAVLSEPLGCIVHALEMAASLPLRYPVERARSVLICGSGPAGLLFTQYFSRVLNYAGQLLVAEPNPIKRALAQRWGATAIDPSAEDLVDAVLRLTSGRKVECLVECSGSAAVFTRIPGLARKQATLILYGHGHAGADLQIMNNVQYLEPFMVASVGASGAIDTDGRPSTYRKALELISSGQIEVGPILTHTCGRLEDVPQVFVHDRFRPDFVKGALVIED